MADAATVDALAATDLFAGVGSRALGKIADRCRRVSHAEGSEIATEGESGVGLHVIVSGTAAVRVHGAPRPGLGPGDYFGEISLLDGSPRSASVVATSPLETISLTSWAFSPILDDEPEVCRALLLKLCARLRAAESA